MSARAGRQRCLHHQPRVLSVQRAGNVREHGQNSGAVTAQGLSR